MQYPLALRASLQALPSGHYEAFIEYAKLLWAQGDYRGAIKALDQVTPNGLYSYMNTESERMKNLKNALHGGQHQSPRARNEDSAKIERYLAKSALLQTRWLDASGQGNSVEVRDRYNIISRIHPHWEKPHYYMAKYYNKIHDSQLLLDPLMRTAESHAGDYITVMVRSYTLSLQFGTKYIYETLPKLITLWLDFSEKITILDAVFQSKDVAKFVSARKGNLELINGLLNRYSTRVPSYVFYTALPQLYSRLSHSDKDVYGVMQNIIVQVTRMYPRQALWFLLGVQNSRRQERKGLGMEISKKLLSTPATVTSQPYSQAALPQTSLRPLVNAATKLVAELSKLCRETPEKLGRIKLLTTSFDTSAIPCGLVVPVREFMCVTLPTQSEGMKHHPAFPASSTVTIEGIESYIEVISSLQKPKKIGLIGSNGARYKILCKSRDDVRKDARLMELTRSIDSLLKRDERANRRRLSISTYWVTPITEDSGLIEWVDGVKPMRTILSQSYSMRGIGMNWNIIDAKLKEGITGFQDLLKTYKPILREWFLETFPEPSAWIESRTKYSRTLAVMSMMGFILG